MHGKISSKEPGKTQPRREKRDVDMLLGSGVRADVLWVLLTQPTLAFVDITRFAQRDPKDVKKALETFKQLELVIETGPVGGGTMSPAEMYKLKDERWIERALRITGQMYYGLNEEHPWLPGLKIIFENSSIGIIPLLREALVSIQGIEVAYVFGSFAIGEQNVRSDIDLVVIGRHDREALDDRMDTFEKRTDRILDPFEYTPEEWIKYLRDYPSFADTMMPKRKLFLIGDDERLERLAKE